MKLVCCLVLIFLFALSACQKDSEEKSILPQTIASIEAITPNNGIAFDTIQIDLNNANFDPRFASVKFNEERTFVLENSTINTLFVVLPIVPPGENELDVSIELSSDSRPIISENSFTYKRIQIDSISSNFIFQNSDTITVYGANFPSSDIQSYRIYERFEGDVSFADLNSHELLEVSRDSITIALSDNEPISDPHELFLYFGRQGGQFVSEDAGEFFSMGVFQLSSFFEVLNAPLTPGQCFFVRNNGFEDQVFIDGIAAPKLFSAPEPFENFNRLSGFRVPAELSPGTYTLTGTNESGTSLKALNGNSITILDISYCPLQNSVSKEASLRVTVNNGVFNTAFCPNSPPEAAFLDAQSGLRFEVTIDPLTAIVIENEQVFFDLDIPTDIPPNAVYELVFTTQSGYRYVPSNSCANATVFITP